LYDNEIELTFVIGVIKDEIAYAKSCIQPTATGHIHTSISWMESRKQELERQLSALSSAG
tara:strand:+ start:37 stop:216 length:180 start_codon:yes stop_codon:yes gene_type:complete